MIGEMLGNQYFLARKYSDAVENLEHALVSNPMNKAAKKKLIICYTQVGKIRRALNVFKELIEEDIDFIINTDLKEDACPCNDLIQKYGNVLPYEDNSTDMRIMLSILWLYCDTEKSNEFFKSLLNENVENEKISSIVKIIENRLKTKQPNKIN
jgi:pentatricopeptide repeat protein